MQIQAKQTGSALIVSLMILLVMTVLGVSSLSGTNLEERMSQNYQHAAMAFQASESAINRVINAGDKGTTGAPNPFYVEANDSLVTAINAGINNTSTVVAYDMDPGNHLANTSLNTNSSVVYRSVGVCPGMSADAATCFFFEITTNASIAATSTSTTHTQGIYRAGPPVSGS